MEFSKITMHFSSDQGKLHMSLRCANLLIIREVHFCVVPRLY